MSESNKNSNDNNDNITPTNTPTTTTTTTTTTSEKPTTTTATTNVQQSPSPSEHRVFNFLNQNSNRLRTLNRATSLQNLSSSQPNGSPIDINKGDYHILHHGLQQQQLKNKLNSINGITDYDIDSDGEYHHPIYKSKEEELYEKDKLQRELELEKKFNLIKYDATNSNHPTPSSKYDFVKVKVQLENHYYVLSRFLISRVLNVTKVDAADSVKISLALKKTLVDQGRLTITQTELENELFKLLQAYGYGKEYIERYKMTTQFHHQRVPLIILISGPKFIGKSWLATQLAERLNLSTVLQTTLVHDLMYTIIKEFQPKKSEGPVKGDHPSNLFGMPSDPPIVFKNHKSKEDLITEFKKECIMIRHGVDTDIEKCFEEGKAIIIEGPHIDPFLYTELIAERNMISPIQFVFEKTKSNEDLIKLELEKQQLLQQQQLLKEKYLKNNNSYGYNNLPMVQTIIPDEIPTTIPPTVNENKEQQQKQQQEEQLKREEEQKLKEQRKEEKRKLKKEKKKEQNQDPQQLLIEDEKDLKEKELKRKEKESKKLATAALLNSLRKPKTKGIIIPFVLSVNSKDHRLLIENWLSTSPYDQAFAEKAFGTVAENQAENILNNLQTIQDYLCTGVPPFQRVEVNAHCLLETLDVLHSAVLKRINTAYSGHVKGFEYES